MSLYLLDTDMVSLFQHGHAKVCAQVANHSPADIGITVITIEEQLSGWPWQRLGQITLCLLCACGRMACV
jgi:hypothetical protein